MDNFSRHLIAWREYRRFSVAELARAATVDYHDIYRVEQGSHDAPSLSKVLKIARALGVTVEQLAETWPETLHACPEQEATHA